MPNGHPASSSLYSSLAEEPAVGVDAGAAVGAGVGGAVVRAQPPHQPPHRRLQPTHLAVQRATRAILCSIFYFIQAVLYWVTHQDG